MKVVKIYLIFAFVGLLFAAESSLSPESYNLEPSRNIWGIAPKSSSHGSLPTDDSTWIKADSVPLPGIGSSDAYCGLKVYGDTIYLMWNRYNQPYRVLKLNRLNGSLISSFDAPSTKYAMSAVKFAGDSVCVSCFYPSEGFDIYTPAGTYVRSFSPPSGFRSRGMDWDGSKFWVSNTQSYANTIYTMTSTGTLLRNLTNTGPVTCYWFFDLTLDRMIPNRLWVNDQETPYVTRYIAFDTSANTYQVNATFTHPGSPTYYPEGIGFYGPEGGNGYVYTEGHASPWAWKMLVHTYTGGRDAGLAAIRSPLTVVDPNSSVTPTAVIKNFGTNAISNIPVYCWIDSAGTRIYNQSFTYSGTLAPNETARVSFSPNWQVGPAGASYQIKMFTDLTNDTNRTNDTARQTTFAFLVRDTLIAPWYQVIPRIDGEIQTAEWADALKWDISDVLNMQGSGARPPGSVFLYVKHDSNNVYWALDFVAKATREDYDQFGCYLDENYNRLWTTDSSEGNHWFVWLTRDTVIYRALIGTGNIPSAYWARWLTGNGISRASTTSGHLQFEAVVAKGTQKWNYTISPAEDTVGFYVYAAAAPGDVFWGTWPTRMSGTNWNNAATYGTLIFSRQQVGMAEGKAISKTEIKINNPLRMPLILKGVKGLSIYDATGKVVKEINEAKNGKLVWDGKDRNGNSIPNGIYFLKMKLDNGSKTTKAIILH